MSQLIECVPNFSEGVDMSIIKQITDQIESVEAVKLLDVDPGMATNRTVVTFVGPPQAVIDAAFLGIKKASELIDMSKHKGAHPRMGATDVCPLIPISGIEMTECVAYANQLAKRVGEELKIQVFMYEAAAKKPDRQNLATIRSGEYEGMEQKTALPEWKPDYGPDKFNVKAGATVIGARDFLIAYNVNINSTSVKRANSVAFDIREKGRVKRIGNPINGEIVRDEAGEPLRVPGMLKSVKAIGWFIEEYGVAQISMNITNINHTKLHEAFEACRTSANKRGLRVTGSELVGLVPKKVMIEAGKFYLNAQQRSIGVSDDELVKIAIKSMGLDELGPFDPDKKIIENLLISPDDYPLLNKNLASFANETASESPAPGGGSIAAYVGSLGVALGTMVANLSANKKGWEDKWDVYSAAAEKGQKIKDQLLYLVDADTDAFNQILNAIRMPKQTDEEKAARKASLNAATKHAINVPFQVMETAASALPMIKDMAENGNPNSISDAGVGALCVYTAVYGAFLNVKINCNGFGDTAFVEEMLTKGQKVLDETIAQRDSILDIVNKEIS